MSFTCTGCQVTFPTFEGQKNHFRLDWHRYNLKRKIVDLPPVSLDQFEVRKRLAQATLNANDTPFHATCKSCKKSFSTDAALQQHLQSKKHIQSIKKNGGGKEVVTFDVKKTSMDKEDNVDEEEEEMEIEFSIHDCLFCSHKEEAIEETLVHMQNVHGFFLPDIEYLCDMEGLLEYLTEKIQLGKMCLFCNGKGKVFSNANDCQKHMISKCHCKLLYQANQDLDEYLEFYDFAASYATNGEVMNEDDENDEEEVDEDLNVETIQISETGEMVLPDGRRLGTRQLQRYYRQNLRVYENRDSVVANLKEKGYPMSQISSGRGITAATYWARRQNNISTGRNIKQSRKAATLFEKHRGRLDFRSHKSNNANRKAMITV